MNFISFLLNGVLSFISVCLIGILVYSNARDEAGLIAPILFIGFWILLNQLYEFHILKNKRED